MPDSKPTRPAEVARRAAATLSAAANVGTLSPQPAGR